MRSSWTSGLRGELCSICERLVGVVGLRTAGSMESVNVHEPLMCVVSLPLSGVSLSCRFGTVNTLYTRDFEGSPNDESCAVSSHVMGDAQT